LSDLTEETLAVLGKNPETAKVYHLTFAFYRAQQDEIKRIRKSRMLHFSNVKLFAFPLIKNLDFSVGKDQFLYFKKIADLLIQLEPAIAIQIRKKKKMSYSKFKAASELFLKENMIDEPDQILLFLLNKTYRPMLILFRKRYGYRISSNVKENYRSNLCPVCGATADVGYLNTSGARMLVCSRCDMQWRYTRGGCSICRADKPEDIEIYLKDDKRIYRCKRCSGLLPVVDMREKIGDFNPIVERANLSILRIEDR